LGSKQNLGSQRIEPLLQPRCWFLGTKSLCGRLTL
jgi:hypothetical protein